MPYMKPGYKVKIFQWIIPIQAHRVLLTRESVLDIPPIPGMRIQVPELDSSLVRGVVIDSVSGAVRVELEDYTEMPGQTGVPEAMIAAGWRFAEKGEESDAARS